MEKLAVLKTVSGADVRKTFAPSRLIQADIGLPDGPQRSAAPRGKLSRRKVVECCRIVDQNLRPDRRIECPFGQLVDLRAIVAGIRWRKILTRLAAARMRPV